MTVQKLSPYKLFDRIYYFRKNTAFQVRLYYKNEFPYNYQYKIVFRKIKKLLLKRLFDDYNKINYNYFFPVTLKFYFLDI